ncbi:DUF3352 domain-containing protein [Leptolyngbya sp. AN02str]|uniref:DUF3352 domain-containing protein n=1 Tax=Leptolyngbya sp. AN02str TaxID=3423363 RepID=UPI003D31ECE8
MKLRSFFLALAGAVLVLLGISAGGFYWLAAQSPLNLLDGGKLSSPAAAMFVPKQAPVLVSLLVDPDDLEAFRVAIAPPEKRRQAREELAQIKASLLSDRGLNYETDIQPWLGDEVTLAVTALDVDRDRSNGQQPGYLLALETKNGDRAREFLQLFWQKRAIAGFDLVFEQYAGVKLIYGQRSQLPALDFPLRKRAASTSVGDSTSNDRPITALATAVVGDRFVLFANSPKVLREAINNVQAPGLSLSSSKRYQQAVQQLSSNRVGFSFANVPQLAQWLNQPKLGQASTQASATSSIEQMVVGLVLNRQGVLADTVILASKDAPFTPSKPALSEPVSALQYLPAKIPFAASGQNLAALWQQLSTALTGYEGIASLVHQPAKALEQEWGVPLSAELVDWVEREFALALLPSGSATDWVFVAEKTPTTQTAIAKLDAIAQKQGLSIGPVTIGEQKTYAWTQLVTGETTRRQRNRQSSDTIQAEVRGVHTSAGKYEIFSTSVEAMSLALNNRANLLNQADFQQAIAPLDSNNNGYLYLDWPTLKPTLEAQLPILQLTELAAKPFFDHVRSLTISSYGGDRTVQRGGLFIRLSNES